MNIDRPTPETDELISVGLENADRECVPADFARKLERERDEATEKAERYRIEANAMMMQRDEWAAMCGRYKQERDEALMDRANGDIATMTINHYERILRERNMAEDERIDLAQQLRSEKESHAKCQNERDEAREALMRIEEVFIDSDDTYEDLIKMGNIARAALGSKNYDLVTRFS